MSINTGKRQVLVDADLDFPSVAANTSEALTVTVAEARLGHAVNVVAPFNVVATASQGTLTLDTEPLDADDMTVDGKVYTFQTVLTAGDGNVAIGADLAATKVNIVAAFDLSGTEGVEYGLGTTAHPTVSMATFVADDAILTANLPGAAGDTIATVETFDEVTNIFDDATLGTTRAGSDASGLSATAAVSADDTVTVFLSNATAGALNPDEGTYRVTTWLP